MRLALWDSPPAEFFVSGLTTGAVDVRIDVERHDARTCTEALQRGMVNVALVPTLFVLSNPDRFDVLPAVALSAWKYPYARLVLRDGLEQVDAVAYGRDNIQEALLARIILREHYGREPRFIPMPRPRLDDLRASEADAFLIVGPEAATLQSDDLALNLGQEWFELANYPMVWGLFAARKDEATPEDVRVLVELVTAAEDQRRLWVQAQEMPPALHTFFTEDLRLRFDDLATASLTEFRQYLYFYRVTEEIPELPLYSMPDEDHGDEGPRSPLI